MASTNYTLDSTDWTDCGAADDCTLQMQTIGIVIFTTAASKPANNSTGLRLVSGSNNDTAASVQRAGMTLWARAASGSISVTVER